jgi:flavoprotein hydroxylase
MNTVTEVGSIDADVTIVGFGPTGNALAILLAQQGHSVLALERWPAPYPLPRAVHFDDEVGRILQSCGIGSAMRALIEPADIYEWRNAAGTTLLRFGRTGDGPSGWPASSMFNQPALEALLEQRAGALGGIELRRGAEVVAVRATEDHVEAHTADGTRVTSRYLVGCDGANSTVRSLCSLPVTDLGFFYDWLIVDVVLGEPRVFDPVNLQICDPDRPTTAVSGGPGRRRWEFMRLPHESLEELNDERRAWELLGPWDVRPDNATLERHAVYTFNARYTERWRAGRVLLAGDAAHQMPPFAGQGMCGGLRDAANLAWKLDLVLRHRTSDTVLDTYEVERLPAVIAVIEFSMELGKVICVPDASEAAARDEAMASMVGPQPSEVPPLPGIGSGLIHPASPGAGELFVQGSVDGALFDDVFGAGWRIVTLVDEADGIDRSLRTWFESIGGRVVRIDGSDPTYAAWFAGRDARWVVQRPDFHVYGTACSPEGVTAVLEELRRQVGVEENVQGGRP